MARRTAAVARSICRRRPADRRIGDDRDMQQKTRCRYRTRTATQNARPAEEHEVTVISVAVAREKIRFDNFSN
jgi:hypothetical protein